MTEIKAKKQGLRKVLFQQAVIIAISLLIAFIIGEIYFRAFYPPIRYGFPKGMYVKDGNPLVGYKMKANFVGEVYTSAFHYAIETNELGYRFSEPIDQNKSNIGVFGDSFAFGQGVEEEENFSSFLYNNLDKKYNIINTGTCGYNPTQEYAVYKQHVNQGVKFDKVIVQLCVNDIELQGLEVKVELNEGRIYGKAPESPYDHLKAFLILNSEFVSRIFLYKETLSNRQYGPKYKHIDRNFETAYGDRIMSTKSLLQTWKRHAEMMESEFILFYIPNRLQVEPNWVKEFSSENIDFNIANKWLNDWAMEDSTLTYLNLVDSFREQLRNEKKAFYFEKNGHCNKDGHKFIADRLTELLNSD